MARREYKNIEAIGISLIESHDAPDDDVVGGLAGSMAEIGLMNPIWVFPVKGASGGTESYRLISGRHRVAAATKLEWTKIDARIVELDDLHAELATIDENLIRGKMTAAQKAKALSRRKKIYIALHPETKRGGTPGNKGGGRGKRIKLPESGDLILGFTQATKAATGESQQRIDEAVARGDAIPDIDKVVGTSLDKGTELDALAKLGPEDQASIIARAAAGEAVSAIVSDGKVVSLRERVEKAILSVLDSTPREEILTDNFGWVAGWVQEYLTIERTE